MPLNREPLRAITDEDREIYARDGVVCLRKVFDPEWFETLLPVSREIIVDKKDFGLLPTMPGRYVARCVPEFRNFVFNSPAAQAAAQVMGSKQVRFFFDEFFAKPPRSDFKTIWHTDRMGWPVSGKMVPSLWIPMHDVSKESSLECIAGSQVQDKRYWLFSPNAKKMIKPEDRLSHPDCEPLRDDPNVRFVSYEMEAGDMLVVHPWVLHYSGGNPSDDWRIAMSIRVFGDDIRWAPRPDCVNLAGVSFDEMLEGEEPAGPLFPVLWSESGYRDTDEHYPRGFATTWTRKQQDEMNPYKAFMKDADDTKQAVKLDSEAA